MSVVYYAQKEQVENLIDTLIEERTAPVRVFDKKNIIATAFEERELGWAKLVPDKKLWDIVLQNEVKP